MSRARGLHPPGSASFPLAGQLSFVSCLLKAEGDNDDDRRSPTRARARVVVKTFKSFKDFSVWFSLVNSSNYSANYDKKPANYDKKPANYDKKPANYDKKPANYDKKNYCHKL